MTSENEKEMCVVSPTLDTESEDSFVNTLEAVRKCPEQDKINTSWEPNYYASSHDQSKLDTDKTPPFVSIMVAEIPSLGKSNSSTQTETSMTEPVNCGLLDVSLSFTKEFNSQGSTSNENSEHCLGNKRYRRDSIGADNGELRPLKKTKCTDSGSSSTSDLTEPKLTLGLSVSSSQVLSSTSDTSFKSINSNHSYKVRKRRLKSDSNLFRDALQRLRKNTYLNKHNYSENNTPGGTPRKEKSFRRNNRTKSWKILDLCTWIGRKSYQSITGIGDLLKEPVNHKDVGSPLIEEVKEMRVILDEVNMKQGRLERENEMLRDDMKRMMAKMEELEGKLRCQENQPRGPTGPPPPPPMPPPPPPPPPLPPASKIPLQRSHTIPRCGSAPPRIAGPRLTITPQDIANVKLRKTKDNPVRSKPMPKGCQQPLVTQQMLQKTRAKLGRSRPIASSTPKQQLSELEKCLLQESSVTSLYRRRVVKNTFRSAEELRVRPYPASRCPRSPCSPRSPRSPRSSSLPRKLPSPLSPHKFPNCALFQ